MKKKYLLLIFMLMVCFFGQSQNPEKLCVCFFQGNDYIDIKIQNRDSTYTYFKVVREGFETEEAREIAFKQYRSNLFDLPPNFYLTFIAVERPIKFDSIDEINCAATISLNEYRKNSYKRPVGTHSNLFVFIQENTDKTFLKWNVLMESIE